MHIHKPLRTFKYALKSSMIISKNIYTVNNYFK